MKRTSIATLLFFFTCQQHSTNAETVLYNGFSIPADIDDWTRTDSASVSDGRLAVNKPSESNFAFPSPGGRLPVGNLTKTSVRTSVEIDGSVRSVGLIARLQLGNGDFYYGGLEPSTGDLFVSDLVDFDLRELAREPTSLTISSGDEVVLQFDAFDDVLTVSAWPVGATKPETPQLTFVDDVSIESGFPALALLATEPSTANYRYFWVADSPLPEPTTCDFDGSGQCDADDIDAMFSFGNVRQGVALLPEGVQRFELQLDGVVDLADRDAWLLMAATENGFEKSFAVGDVDLDGFVNASDLNALALNWQSTSTTNYTEGDVNGDGKVDSSDLNGLAINWQKTIAAAPVPEPKSNSMCALLFVALAVALRGNKR